jgi:ubiquitin carboxyl-terminal hydrolase 8
VLQKPQIETTPDREAQLETLPQQIASEQEWKIYRMRNDSLVVDYFQGQFRNRLQCLTCRKVGHSSSSMTVTDGSTDLDDI